MQVNNHIDNTSTNTWLVIGLMALLLLSGSGLLNYSGSFTLPQINTDSSAALSEIELATAKARKRISQFAIANPASFTQVLQQSFGTKLNAQAAHDLTQRAALGQLPVAHTIVFVPTGLLEGASGAYAAQDGGLILLDEGIRHDSAALSDVILHEWAHHIDASLGPVDAIGEEGDIFLRGIRNTAPLSPSELRQLQQSEHGHRMIMSGGKYIAVEQGFFDFLNIFSEPDPTPWVTVCDIGPKWARNNAAELGIIQPELGTLDNMALGLTPAGPLAAVSMGLADTVNGIKNDGLEDGLQSGLFAAIDVGMSAIGRTNKGLKTAEFNLKAAPKQVTPVLDKIKAEPSKLSSTLKKKVAPIYKIDDLKLTKATPTEVALGKMLMKPSKASPLTVVTTPDKIRVKKVIGITKTVAMREGERDSDGVLLGKENKATADVCPEEPTQDITMRVHKELIRLGYEATGDEANKSIKYFQKACRCMGDAPKACITKELLAKLESSAIECSGKHCKLVQAVRIETVNIITGTHIKEAAPSDACEADISNLVSLRQCCDAKYDKAFDQCYVSPTEDAAQACEEEAAEIFNDCLRTQQSRNSTGGGYTERAAPPMQGSSSPKHSHPQAASH